MLNYLWLLPVIPLLGFVILAAAGKGTSKSLAAWVGAGSVGVSALIAIGIAITFSAAPPEGMAFRQTLWTWMKAGDFEVDMALYLDALSLAFVLVITFVGFLIHLYSVEFMREEEGYHRFFAYMNLFIGTMLLLVLADNLVLLYLGWEGVGLCSYLLIGIWYRKPENGYAAQKAFIMTRVGDTALAIALFLLFTHFGTLTITELSAAAGQEEEAPFFWIAALLLLGAAGKSAQLPLQTWLPDAMAGPSPVSALIHAATMVTAGVYLLARMHVFMELSPVIMALTASCGALTLLLAAASALVQTDIKKVLAYSTMSQVGYMFLALGVGAWSAAIFHFFTHAFFKALLFLGAGVLIHALDHERNLFKMGGLRERMPLTFWTFTAGAAALAALPLLSAGFYSKDQILWYAWSSTAGSPWLWGAGWIGAFLTALYTTRMLLLAFFGESRTNAQWTPGWRVTLPLLILAFLSLTAGFLDMPHTLAEVDLFADWQQRVLPAVITAAEASVPEYVLQLVSGITVLLGIYFGYLFFMKHPAWAEAVTRRWLPVCLWWYQGWGFDWFYDRLFVKPYVWLAKINREDIVDDLNQGFTATSRALYRMLISTQSGQLRWYAFGIGLGVLIILTVILLA